MIKKPVINRYTKNRESQSFHSNEIPVNVYSSSISIFRKDKHRLFQYICQLPSRSPRKRLRMSFAELSGFLANPLPLRASSSGSRRLDKANPGFRMRRLRFRSFVPSCSCIAVRAPLQAGFLRPQKGLTKQRGWWLPRVQQPASTHFHGFE